MQSPAFVRMKTSSPSATAGSIETRPGARTLAPLVAYGRDCAVVDDDVAFRRPQVLRGGRAREGLPAVLVRDVADCADDRPAEDDLVHAVVGGDFI
jgi:hypothetical protein